MTTTRPYTLADATDARHLNDLRAIVRERRAEAKLMVEAARFELRRWTRLLRSVERDAAITTRSDYANVIESYREDVRRAQELYDEAVVALTKALR